MTCEEFIRLNGTEAAFSNMSRAERAACDKHHHSCEKCRLFIANVGPDEGASSLTREEAIEKIARVVEQYVEDQKDPEVQALWTPPEE